MLERLFPLQFLVASVALFAQEPGFESLREEGRWKQLRPRIEAMYQAKPQDPYSLMWMSRLKQAYGDPQAALELARQAVALKSTDPELQTQLGVAARAALDNTKNILKMYPYAKEWKKALYAALALNPESGEVSDSQLTVVAAEPWHEEAIESLIYFYLGAPSIAGGSNSKARELAVQITRIEPVTGLVFQARVAFNEGDFEKAKSLLQQALSKDPACKKAHRQLIRFLLSRKPQPLDTIIASCRKALESNPATAEFHAYLASGLAEQGKLAELETCLTEARRACPENLLPYIYAAESLIDNQKLGQVESFLQTYLSQDPEAGTPGRATTLALLGDLYQKQGRRPEAIKAYEDALRLRPTYEYAQKGLKRAKKG